MKLVIVGQGYVGLPLAMRAVSVGHEVVGIDSNQFRVDCLLNGRSPVAGVDDAEVESALSSERYRVTSSYVAASGFACAIIAVPTPVRGGLPFIGHITDAVTGLAPYISRGSMVVLESTTYPGTTEDNVVPLIARLTGLKVPGEVHVGFSPEQVDPGNLEWTLGNTPKLVSAVTAEALEAIRDVYESFVSDVIPVSSPRVAELSKLLENAFRYVNIAFVNEVLISARAIGVDPWEVLAAARSKPFGFLPFQPGPGVGGHCLPSDAEFLAWSFRSSSGGAPRMLEAARIVNESMPRVVAERCFRILESGSSGVRGRVLLLGLAYKAGLGDLRDSPGVQIAGILLTWGLEVLAADPFVADSDWPSDVGRLYVEDAGDLAGFDLVVLVTAHPQFVFDSYPPEVGPILDTRHVLAGDCRVEYL